MTSGGPNPGEDEREQQVLDAVRHAFAEAERRAPGMILCRAGCDSCCRKRPFSITMVDAARLRRGMAAMELSDPETATGIRERAAAYSREIEADFPGDFSRGAITDSVEWRDWFYDRHLGLACPALGPESGACLVHEFRPVCCRLYGPLIQIGAEQSGPCPLNYEGLSRPEIEARSVQIDLPELNEPAGQETMIVFALLHQMASRL